MALANSTEKKKTYALAMVSIIYTWNMWSRCGPLLKLLSSKLAMVNGQQQ